MMFIKHKQYTDTVPVKLVCARRVDKGIFTEIWMILDSEQILSQLKKTLHTLAFLFGLPQYKKGNKT